MPEPARVLVTDAEIDAALGRAREYAKYARKVVKASYSKSTDSLRIVLDDGATYSVPRSLIQGLHSATEKELNRIQVVGGGTGLLWPHLDVAHYVPGLLQGVYGSEKWMTALYRQRRKLTLVKTRRDSKRRTPLL
jgi:predicted TPR repeat methyltransferase